MVLNSELISSFKVYLAGVHSAQI